MQSEVYFAGDPRGRATLIEGLTCGQILADRALDAKWVRETSAKASTKAVMPPQSMERLKNLLFSGLIW